MRKKTNYLFSPVGFGLNNFYPVYPEYVACFNDHFTEVTKNIISHAQSNGGVGSQQLLPFGTPDKIRAEIRRLCREMGRGGGYILGLAKAFQPETPTLNAVAAIEEFLGQAGIAMPRRAVS